MVPRGGSACLAIVCMVAVASYASACTQWEVLNNVHSSNGDVQTAGHISLKSCFDICAADATCLYFDYDARAGITLRCYTFTVIKTIGSLLDTLQVRKSDHACHVPTYYELTSAPGACLIYRHHNYAGLPTGLESSSTTVANLAACRDLCMADFTCQSYEHTPASNLCRLFDYTYGDMITYSPGVDYYTKSPCDERDSMETGFFLYSRNLKANGGTLSVLPDFPTCWLQCWNDWNCEGFDWNESITECLTHGAATVNSTVAAAGYHHHRLLESDAFSSTFTSVTTPTNLPTSPAVNCLLVEFKLNTRSYGATLAPQGNANLETCVEYCRSQGAACAAIDYENKANPFKGIKCYTFAITPTVTVSITDRHQVVFSSSTCLAATSTSSTAACTWVEYSGYSGISPSLTGTASSATTLSDCETECEGNRDCWAIDWTATTTSCVYYDAIAAYWWQVDANVRHFVRKDCT